MPQLINFKLATGAQVSVEVAQNRDAAGLVGKTETATARQTFEEALSYLKPVADAVFGQVLELASKPSEVSVELGVTLKAEAGLIIARTAGEGNLKLTLKWKSEG